VKIWKLEDAKARFSELVRRADDEPQMVTRRGKETVVVVSVGDYERLTARRPLTAFLRDSPLAEALGDGELDLTRSKDRDRDIEL
jgi:antitoxin Phd